MVLLIFICIAVDNMVIANMSGMKPQNAQSRSSLSLKIAIMFALFNGVMLLVGYILGYFWMSAAFGPKSVAWVNFAFITLIGIRLLLESIEKSPSFAITDDGINGKFVKVSLLVSLNYMLIGFALRITASSLSWNFFGLLFISVAAGIIGFGLGSPDSKSIASKKLEAVAGIILIVIAIYRLLTSGIF